MFPTRQLINLNLPHKLVFPASFQSGYAAVPASLESTLAYISVVLLILVTITLFRV